jgi:hypothetical protein
MSKSRQIGRRTVLRGMGAAVALPWLESLSFGSAGAPEGPPRRMAFLFVPNGAHMPDWKPKEEGPLGTLPPILKPLRQHKSDLLVLSGLTLDGGRPHGDGPGDHARCVASFLTSAHPRKTAGKDIRNGISVDQVAAREVGERTRFPSLELGCEPSAQAGRCDSGYSCVYTSNVSWRTPTSPMTKEVHPRAVFDRLFGGPAAKVDRAVVAKQSRYRKSILDLVAEDARSLRDKLGKSDRQKLDEYLFAVRQVERRIDDWDKAGGAEPGSGGYSRPAGAPKDFAEHVRLMMDMIVLAFRTDSTRIATFMVTNAGSNRSYPEIGVRAGHHTLSHHQNDPKKQAQISKINRYHVTLLTHLLDGLKSVPQGNGTLLDYSMIVYGSGLSDGNRHNHDNLPILLLGKGGGTIRPGRHRSYPKETPLAGLYLAMLHRMGATVDSFGDSRGMLNGLS